MADTPKVIPFPRRRRAARVSPPLTAELASKIKTLVIMRGMAQQIAAAKLGVNQGRVSEVMNGLKFPEAPFAPIHEVINL
jgi:hypothetical protein